MLRFLGGAQPTGDGFTRREVLQVGGLASLGLTLAGISGRVSAGRAATSFGRAKSCVVVFLFGGPSQLDTFDMKPDAPPEFRGEFRPIATNVPGIQICEHLPRLSRQADRLCLIRSMNHPHPRHGWGLYYMLTGRPHNRPDLDAPPTPDDFPGLGAMVTKLVRPVRQASRLSRQSPPAVTLPRWNRFLDLPNDYAGEKAGFLGCGFNPWLVTPGANRDAPALNLEVPLEVPVARLAGREGLLQALERRIAGWGETAQAYDSLHGRAYEMIASTAVRRAFRLDEEPEPIRRRYGSHPFGQGLLLARRLIEAGTKLVQVNWHKDSADVKSPF